MLKTKSIIYVVTLSFLVAVNSFPMHHNGHIGPLDSSCDNAINGIGIDWNGLDDFIPLDLYTCSSNEPYPSVDLSDAYANETCEKISETIHVCINEAINYTDPVPLSGPHRPIWPAYGEYSYLPPQRWVHSLEHGGVVFLYDPCAGQNEIEAFKQLAESCLRRYVMTPYKGLTDGSLFNVLTFGCKLQLNKVIGKETEIVDYMRRHAIKDGPEKIIARNGQYKFGLLKNSKYISDIVDSNICPNYSNLDDLVETLQVVKCFCKDQNEN